jgi:hypothetical protein
MASKRLRVYCDNSAAQTIPFTASIKPAITHNRANFPALRVGTASTPDSGVTSSINPRAGFAFHLKSTQCRSTMAEIGYHRIYDDPFPKALQRRRISFFNQEVDVFSGRSSFPPCTIAGLVP